MILIPHCITNFQLNIYSISLSEALSALKKVGIEEDIFQIDPVPREVFIRKTQSALYEMGNNFKPVPM